MISAIEAALVSTAHCGSSYSSLTVPEANHKQACMRLAAIVFIQNTWLVSVMSHRSLLSACHAYCIAQILI